jgi:hypothetical protein
MPRGLTTAQKTAIAGRVTSVAYLVHLDLAAPANDVRVWTGRGDLTALSNTWRGVGEFGLIEGVAGERSLKAGEISLALAGIPGDLITPGIIAETRGVRYQGRPLTIYLAVFDPVTNALIDNPTAVWGGFADVLSFQLGEQATVALTGQHYDSLMRRSNGWNMSTVSHNLRFGLPPNTDLFFEPNDRLMGVARPVL